MASEINDDKKVLADGRKETLKKDLQDTDPVSVRDKVNNELLEKLEKVEAAEKIRRVWTAGNMSRHERLRRQEHFLDEFDEFIEPIHDTATDWSSNLHMPVALTICKTFHARMMAAVMGMDPPFTVAARQAANSDRAPLVQELMRYAVKDWSNEYKGIEEEMDKWIWAWVTGGTGIMKLRWDKQYTKFVDVETVMRQGPSRFEVDPDTGETIELPTVEAEEVEREVVQKTFDGPCIEFRQEEDVLIVGGDGDPDKADAVIDQFYLNASDLWTLVDRGIFKEDAVRQIIQSGEDKQAADMTGDIKQTRREKAGEDGPDVSHDLQKYQILEAYVRMDIDGSGINSDLVVWLHQHSGAIPRATYLYRMNRSGRRPFAKIDFHKRAGSDYGAGLVELLYSLTKEIDAMHNMRVDFGLLTTMPFGYYRPTGNMATERIPLEPGTLVPLEDPSRDVFFPNLGNRTSFGFQEEASLMNQVERVTSISDLSLGLLGQQGAARTATGARAVIGESNANLDVFLKRLNRGFNKVLKYLFELVQMNMPEGMQFRIMGDSGDNYWRRVETRAEIEGMYDFELEASSANSNKSIQLETAQQIYQLTSNPLDIQLGIITPLERYEAIRTLLQTFGVKDVGRYIKKPNPATRIFTPQEIANRVLQGIDMPLGPEQDLDGFIAFFEDLVGDDEKLGMYSEDDTVRLAAKAKEAQQLSEALKSQQAQQANLQQMRLNAAASQEQANPGLNPLAGIGGTNSGGVPGQGQVIYDK